MVVKKDYIAVRFTIHLAVVIWRYQLKWLLKSTTCEIQKVALEFKRMETTIQCKWDAALSIDRLTVRLWSSACGGKNEHLLLWSSVVKSTICDSCFRQTLRSKPTCEHLSLRKSSFAISSPAHACINYEKTKGIFPREYHAVCTNSTS